MQVVREKISTDRYPRTLPMSGGQPSRSRRRAVACSLPCQCVRTWQTSASGSGAGAGRRAYWTTSGRMGTLKTFGRVCVSAVAEPSAPTMLTVGRLVMFAAASRGYGGLCAVQCDALPNSREGAAWDAKAHRADYCRALTAFEVPAAEGTHYPRQCRSRPATWLCPVRQGRESEQSR